MPVRTRNRPIPNTTNDAEAANDVQPIFAPERLEHIAIEDLKLIGRQPRVHGARQKATLERSIRRFGFVNPAVIDEDSRVVCGRLRVETARALGMKSVPCIRISHLSPEETRALALMDNRVADLAGWDKSILREEFEALSIEAPELDFSLTGFTIPEIEAIRFEGLESADEDVIPLHPEKPVTRQGDLWLLGKHRLYCGDACEEASYRAVTGGEACAAAFTDPPYNISVSKVVTSDARHGEFVAGSGEMTDETFVAFLTACYRRLWNSVSVGAVAFTAMDWRSLHLSHEAAVAAGFELLNLCVWDKGRGGMGSLYRSQHELFHVWKKPGAKHTNTIQLGRNGRNRTNIWRYEGMAGAEAAKRRLRALHPTVKPVALIRDALLDCTEPADTVLDPFGGSGSTLIACETIGRSARLIELDPKDVDVAICRYQALTGGEAVHAESGLTFAELACQRARKA
jgi:DNA modification methylase